LLPAAAAAVLLAGCGGGGPHMARHDAAPLIKLADRIAREAPCAQARDIRLLRARTVALVNAHHVPHALQEPLLSGVNAFVEPPCLPAVPTDSTPPYVAPTPSGRGHGHGHGHGEENGGGEGGD
jgi:hypothetical protein